MNKNLYTVFGLADPDSHRRAVQGRMEEMRQNGQLSEEEYRSVKRNRRRQGNTTRLIIKAIDQFLQGKRVILRVLNRHMEEDVKNKLRVWMPLMLSHRNFYVVKGTVAGHELHGREFDVLLDDDKRLWR